MAAFVLVHGSFHGGWCYARVARLLRAAGHEVFTPTLTGLGERSHLLSPAVDLETHIQDVVNVILWEDIEHVVLCGHSSGGMVVTGVADRIPDRIAALAYIDAVVPDDGDALLDRLPSHIGKAILDKLRASGALTLAPFPASAWVNVDDQAWVDAKCTPQPKASMTQKIRLTGAYRTVSRRLFLFVPGGTHESRHRQFIGQSGCIVRPVANTGHDIMIDQPRVLSEALSELARGELPEGCP